MTKTKTADPDKAQLLLNLGNLRKHKNMFAEMITSVKNADMHDKNGIFAGCEFDLHLAVVHLKMVNDVLDDKIKEMESELGVDKTSVPDGWTADEWDGILHILFDYKRPSGYAEVRRCFVIAEHSRLGNIINIIDEYHITVPVLFLWIDGCDMEGDVTPEWISEDDKAAMKRLDIAFKEANT